jgi:hypothetical protein
MRDGLYSGALSSTDDDDAARDVPSEDLSGYLPCLILDMNKHQNFTFGIVTTTSWTTSSCHFPSFLFIHDGVLDKQDRRIGDGRGVFQGRLKEYLVPGVLKPGQRKLIQKIDFSSPIFCCLSYFLKYENM